MAADQEVPRVPSLYRKVAEDIKAAIAAGGYAAGTRLPSEHELAERYSVSRGTVRQAFAALRADGIIASRRGARRVVVGGARVQSFADAEHVIDAVAATAEDARLLGVRPRVPMLRERRLTTDLAGTPVEWSDDRYLGGAVAFGVRNSVAVNALSRTPRS
jgi:DNA-binding GntR family transcriptional regulator